MTNEFLYLLKLLCGVINGQTAPLPPAALDWGLLYEDANAQAIGPLLFSAVNSLPEQSRPPEELMRAWKLSAFRSGLGQMEKDAALRRLLMRADEENLHVIVFKGPVLASLYPSSASRISVDADLLVDPMEADRFALVLEEEGYSYQKEFSAVNENTYVSTILSIEVHERLWEEAAGPRHDNLCALGMGDIARAARTEVLGTLAWMLPPQEMEFYLVYHMIKHFFVCGIGIRYLSDLTLYTRRYAGEINWERFWSEIELLGYTTFTRCFFWLCAKYMELPAELVNLSGLEEDEELCAQRMLDDFCAGGHNGKKTAVRYKAGRVLRIYYENEENTLPHSKWAILRQMFFPKRSELENRRTETKEYSSFIPLAWLQNLGFLFTRWRERREARCSLKDRINCAQARLELLHNLKLMK